MRVPPNSRRRLPTTGKWVSAPSSEVEGALSAGVSAGDRDQILARGDRENERALELANIRYRVGTIDLRGVEQQLLALHTSRIARLRMQSERLVQHVNLHLALGGKFDVATP